MLFDAFDDLNWLAVVVATVVWFVLGALWYSDVLFGKQWREAAGVEMAGSPSPQIIIGNLVLYFIGVVTMALVASSIGADDFGDGVVLGVVTSIGFVGVNRAVAGLYEGMNRKLMNVNGPLNVLAFVVVAVIVSVWD